MTTNCLITGHEAEMTALAETPVNEQVALKIQVRCGSPKLAHPMLQLGQQPDGSVVLLAETWRRPGQSLQEVTSAVLATCFFARSANWVEESCGDPPHWTVSGVDYLGFRAGLIARYWDGSL